MSAPLDLNVYLSAWRAEADLSRNLQRQCDLAHALDQLGYPYRVCLGKFKGCLEQSLEVFEVSESMAHELALTAGQFQQDTVLVVQPDTGKCRLITTDGHTIPLQGAWQEITAHSAGLKDSYTYVGGEYWYVQED